MEELTPRRTATCRERIAKAVRVMVKPVSLIRSSSIPLALNSGNEVVFPSDEPVIGWNSDDPAVLKNEPRPLIFPLASLKAAVTSQITYSCNLPSPFGSAGYPSKLQFLDENGVPPSQIGSGAELGFLNASLAGGHAQIFHSGTDRTLLKFRWICMTADHSIGALWRCYTQLRHGAKLGCWQAAGADYYFDPKESLGLYSAVQEIFLETGEKKSIQLVHPSGGITQFPCASERVKVTCLAADGWAKRSLRDIRLCPTGNVVASFSDGHSQRIGIAAVNKIDIARAA